MFILIFFLILFILQLILFVLALKRKQKKIWEELFIIEGISLISIPIYAKIFESLNVGSSWGELAIVLVGLIVSVIDEIFIIISIITKIILRKKIIHNQEKSKLLLLISLVIVLFIICTIPDIKPLLDEQNRRKEISENTITYLNNRYGNGNYEIESINDLSYCFLCTGEKAYELIIKTDYLDEKFKIKISMDTKEIKEDSFLSEYYKKDYNKSDFNREVEDIIYNEMTNHISDNSGYKVNLEILINNDIQTNYGKIPTIDELKEEMKQNADITFKNFIIYKDFVDEEEFKTFMIDVYKEYLLNYKKYNEKDLISFTFMNGNPFFEDTMYGYYKDSGYIKEQGDNIYIYNNASPIIVALNDLFSDK